MNQIENKKFQKLIYVGKSINNELEQVAKEDSILITTRLQNEYNMTSLFKEDLKAINNTDFLVLDLAAFVNSTTNEEILRNLDKLRGNFEFKIVIIASGFKKGNEVLASCFNMGIYNIVTAATDTQMYDQLKICLSEKGMTYAQASQFRIESLNVKKSNSEVIKTNYEKVRQDISIRCFGNYKAFRCNDLGN